MIESKLFPNSLDSVWSPHREAYRQGRGGKRFGPWGFLLGRDFSIENCKEIIYGVHQTVYQNLKNMVKIVNIVTIILFSKELESFNLLISLAYISN